MFSLSFENAVQPVCKLSPAITLSLTIVDSVPAVPFY
jgi:hypothetical protein